MAGAGGGAAGGAGARHGKTTKDIMDRQTAPTGNTKRSERMREHRRATDVESQRRTPRG